MFPSPHRATGQPSLSRYGSAPGSFLRSVVDSVMAGSTDDEFSPVGSESLMTRYFSGDSSSLTTTTTTTDSKSINLSPTPHHEIYRPPERLGPSGLQRSFGLNQLAVGDLSTANNNLSRTNSSTGGGGGGGGSSSLIRHSSSPAGFFNHLVVDNGFTVSRGIGNYNSQAGTSGHGTANARLASQLSFTRQDSLSQISEVSESIGDGSSSDDGVRNAGQAYVSGRYPMGSWDDGNTIMFSQPSNKRAKTIDGDIIAALSGVDSQFSLPRTSLEMAAVEKLLQIQPDSVPCKIRAKRGFATHPRSIAERERRTRISDKLRKLQELVPNMDKQTSTADMLDLAVQHIKGLQTEVQKLNKDLDHCTCGSSSSKPTL
ncbi:Transcription factor bhlh [Thalictrum thalictroides]|uniref:Transcription factor bhlh n=1 Tax=Thalictrum thalictroides TaxID=46969 RepID=A0A7J6XAB4_THATH|nr:Transcription factor bhlh [Thalictrum thalictroides]